MEQDLPAVKRFLELDFGIVILNPNENSVKGEPVAELESPVKHLIYAWDNVIKARFSGEVGVGVWLI